MLMTIEIFSKTATNNLFSQDIHSNIYTSLLSSCSSWIILTISALLLTQVSPVRAMDLPEDLECTFHSNAGLSVLLSSDNKKKFVDSTGFYKDKDHPLTQNFWKKHDLSDRLKALQPDIARINEEIASYKTNLIEITVEELEKYKSILNCDIELTQYLQDILHNKLLIHLFKLKEINSGRSGNKVIIASRNGKIFIAVKQFEDIKKGLQELLYSLVAFNINPLPHKLKMAKVYDAALFPGNYLSIIMEGANGCDIHDLSPTDLAESVKSCAKYLAKFHIASYHLLNKNGDRKKYIAHAAEPFHTLVDNPLQEEEKKEIEFLSLVVRTQDEDFEKINSSNIIQLLSKEMQEKLGVLVKQACDRFKKNCGKMFRSEAPYILTITHGDAHIGNFFYNGSEDLKRADGSEIRKDSLHRITMIDFASIVKTYGNIGDPAEDVGRFLGSLWDLVEQSNSSELTSDEKISSLQDQFIQAYLYKITKSRIFEENNQKIFEKIFTENCNFYKLRFYRAVFNSEKDNGIKLSILKSWIKENSQPEQKECGTGAQPQKSIKINSKTLSGDSNAPDKKYTPHFLPDPVEGFIASAPKRSEKSYLEILREKLYSTGVATLSSTATIAGEGGIGKTSLALEYAHRAYKANGYDLIYWLSSGSEFSLFKGYRELLLELGCSTKDIKSADKDRIIVLIKQHVQNKGRCLLIYDNVPDATFLENMLPENAHILMTSRCNEGWKKQPLMLNVFHPEDSINYFLNFTGLKEIPENRKIAAELAEQLGHLPLALAHAAHYIKLEGGNEVSEKHFKEYLEGFKKISVEYFEEKKNPFTEEKSKITHEHLIARTFRMAEAYISKSQKQPIAELAKKLLGYCSYLDSEAIAEEFFLGFCKDKEELDEALDLLSSLSLIKKVKNEPLFSMHRLEQLVIRSEKESKPNSQSHEVFAHLVPVFNTLFEKNINTDEQIDKLLNYSAHIFQLLQYSKNLKSSFEESESPSGEIEHLEWIGRILYITQIDNVIYSKKGILCKKNQVLKKVEKYKLRSCKTGVLFKNVIQSDDIPGWLVQIAEKSNPRIQYILSSIYGENGVAYISDGDNSKSFVARNDNKAFFWCKKAAKRGYAKAQFDLGVMYTVSESVVMQKTEAKKWFMMAATQGHAEAQYCLGELCLEEVGVNKDTSNALKWLTMASKQGHFRAKYKLGEMYHNGEGVEQDFRKAAECYKEVAREGDIDAQLKGTYPNAWKVVQDFEQLAECYKIVDAEGYEDSQFKLGEMYHNGEGVEQDFKKAAEYYRAAAREKYAASQEDKQDFEKRLAKSYKVAAKEGDIDAQFKLGSIYLIGRGVKQSNAKAAKWFKAAAMQGDIEAQYSLGLVYACGLEMEKEAFKCMESAAEQGHIKAQVALGSMYENGLGVIKSDKEALNWYIKAAANGNPEADQQLLNWYIKAATGNTEAQEQLIRVMKTFAGNGQKVTVKWYTKVVEGGKGTARFVFDWVSSIGIVNNVFQRAGGVISWICTTAKKGYAFAQRWVHNTSQDVDKNNVEGIKRYILTAEQGDAEAQFNLGWMYAKGRGVAKDDKEALKWHTKAAKHGNAHAQFNVAVMHHTGRGVKQSYQKAAKWYCLAAEQGHAEAQFILGCMHAEGRGVNQDDFKAIKYLTEAVEQRHAGAQCILGFMHAEGRGVEQNHLRAIEYYKMAAEQNHTEAQFKLGINYLYGEDGAAQDTFQAMEWFSKAAAQEHADAQYELGGMYVNGQGTEQDYGKALQCFTKAGGHGHAVAQYNLGVMYTNGQGVKKDDIEAIKWLTKAAEQEHPIAQYLLGVMYENGRGTKQDYEKAVEWYIKAAEQEHAGAQCNLGVMHENGRGTKQDYEKAVEWFIKAAEQEYASAQYNLGVMYDEGRGIAKDDAAALKWYVKAAERGEANAQNNLGSMYAKGQGVEKDHTKAVKWYMVAAEQGHMGAQYNLGNIYANGWGVAQSYEKAAGWYTMAAKQGFADAQNNLGLSCANGLGVQQDYEKAVGWYRLAAKQGHTSAQFSLGQMYKNARGVKQNYGKAAAWYAMAAQQGFAVAQYNLGVMYTNGQGVKKDDIEAIKWLTKAAENGNVEAKTYLKEVYANDEELLPKQLFPTKIIHLPPGSNVQDKIKNSYNVKGKCYFALSVEYANEGRVDLAKSFAAEASIMFKLAQEIPLTKELQEEEIQWHLKMTRFNKKGALQEQQCYESSEEVEKPATKIVKRLPENVSQPFSGKGKEEMIVALIRKQEDNRKELSHEKQLSRIESKIIKSAKIAQQTSEHTPHIKSNNIYALQADAYTSAAVQHAEEGNTQLAIHLFEEADKKHQEAEDAQLAAKLQEEEFSGNKLQ